MLLLSASAAFKFKSSMVDDYKQLGILSEGRQLNSVTATCVFRKTATELEGRFVCE